MRRSLLGPVDEELHDVCRARGQGLHTAITVPAHPALHTTLQGSLHHGPAVADALDVSTDVKVPGDGGGTFAAAGGVHALFRQRTRLRCWLQPAHHGSARPAVLRALSCNAVVVAWLLVLSCCCALQPRP